MRIETRSGHQLDSGELNELTKPQFMNPQPEHYSAATRIGMAVESLSRVTGPHSYIGRSSELARSLAHRLANPFLPIEEILEHSYIQRELLEGHLLLAAKILRWAADVFCNDDSLNDPEL